MKKRLLISTLIIMGSLSFAKDLQSLVNKANNKIISNDLEAAETLLQNVLYSDPSFAPAHIAFSKIWLRKGDLSKANEYATLAVRIDEDFRSWWKKLNEIRAGIQNGQKYIQLSNFTKAFDEYEEISEKYPYFSQIHYFMGITKYKQKDFKEAALFFENALKIYPDYHKAKKALNNVRNRFPN